MWKKRILALFLSFIMLIGMLPTNAFAETTKSTAWDGTTVTEPGTDEDGVYQIGTAEELAWFEGLVNGRLEDVTKTPDASAILTADIDLNNQTWVPIGNSNSNIFKGTFDGDGKTISGLYVNGNTYGISNMYTGLFGNTSRITIEDLTVKGTVITSGNFSGGIAGKAGSSSKIENCVSYVNITNSGTSASQVGGIVGNVNNTTVTDCIYYGNISSSAKYVGGIAGQVRSGGTVETCKNFGDISSMGEGVGGVVGYLYYGGTVKECVNEGMVVASSKEYTGGIVGFISTSSKQKCEVNNCYNLGMVVSDTAKVGGITGSMDTAIYTSISNCYNLGTVVGNGGSAAGIAGINAGSITNCYTVGTLKLGGSNIGNVVGSSTGTIENCYYLENMLKSEDTNGTAKSADDMKSAGFVTTLGAEFKAGCTYPILSWQTDGTHAYDEKTGKCTECQHQAEHVWKDATCTKPMTCTLCEETRGEKIGHLYAEGICVICGKNLLEADPFEIQLSENSDVLTTTKLETTNVVDSSASYYFVTLDKNVSSVFVKVGEETYSSAYTIAKHKVADLTTAGTVLELKEFAVDISDIVKDTTSYDTTSKEYYAILCGNADISAYFYVVIEMPKKIEEAEKVAPTAITLPTNTTVYVGDKLTLSPTFTPENAYTDVTWTSADPNIATVDSQGAVRGIKEGTVEITVTSEKNSAVTATTTLTVSTVNKYNIDWAGTFNNRYDNNTVSSVKLPASASDVTERWSADVGNSTIAVVGDYIYTYACSQGMDNFNIGGQSGTFYKINKETGEIVKTNTGNKGKGSYFYGYTIYGEKYVYVSCPNGVMAFNPDTCELVWETIYENEPSKLGSYCCAQYVNGSVVVNGMVFDGKDGSLIKDLEGDYNYSSGAMYGNYFYVADYNGVLYAFDTTTWEKIDSLTFKTGGSTLQPGVLYYNGRLYWGDAIKTNVYSVALGGDGKINAGTLITTVSGYTTACTPVAYGNRIYLAGQVGSMGGDGYVGVYSADNLQLIYKTEKQSGVSEIKSTPILYADETTGTVYLWMQSYNTPGTIYYLEDTKNATSGSLTKLVDPSGKQYAFEQIACDKDGALYATNNSGKLFKFMTADAEVPTFTTDLSEETLYYVVGAKAEELKVAASLTGEGILSYQWQKSTDGTTWSDIEGATKASYTPSTEEKSETYYRCTVSNTEGDKTASIISKVKLISVIKESEQKIKISFRLIGATKSTKDIDFESEPGNYCGSTYETWIATTTYELQNGTTLGEVFKMAMEKAGLSYKGLERDYITSITKDGFTLEEFDNGTYSGWMYTVNGKHPGMGLNTYRLGDGDVVVFHYVNDYRFEDESTNPNSEYLNKWLEAEDKVEDKEPHVHTWDAGKITKAATCTEDGTKTYTCSCGQTKTETIKATGHSYGDWITASAATVSAAEVQRHTCTACGHTETKTVGSKLKATIKVTATTVTLKMKQKTKKFKVTGLAKGDAVKKYESSNKKIFTVTQKGVITAGKKAGKATLTITLKSGLKKKVTVKVQKAAVTATKIAGLKSKVTVKKGKKLTLKPTVKPFTCVQKVTYTTSNKKIATVNKKGVITAKKAGNAKITVKCGKKKFTVKVTVKK